MHHILQTLLQRHIQKQIKEPLFVKFRPFFYSVKNVRTEIQSHIAKKVAIRTDEKLLQHQSCINSQNITFILHTSPTENVCETPPPSKTMPRHFTFSFMGDEPLPAHRSVTISNKKKQTCIQSGSVNNTSQMQRKTPSTADVRPLERSSLTSKSAKTGKVQAPLKDVSNTKVPNTDAAPPKVAKRPAADAATSNKITVQLSEGNLHLLNQVSSQWRTGKGRSQTSKCLDTIRICLGNDISPADVANHVAKDLEADIQAMEFKRARECAKRISKSTEKQATRGREEPSCRRKVVI